MQFGIQEDMKFHINVGCVQPNYIRSDSVRKAEFLTQAEYDALEHPDERTLYIISVVATPPESE